MMASITQSKIAELDGYIMHKDQKEGLMTVLIGKEKGFVDIKRQFDEYEKNKLIKEKFEATIENYQLKIGGLQTKLTEYDKMLDKIKANEHIDGMLIKAGLRLEDLERQKTQKQTQINSDEYSIKSLEEKIKSLESVIEKNKDNPAREGLYKKAVEELAKLKGETPKPKPKGADGEICEPAIQNALDAISEALELLEKGGSGAGVDAEAVRKILSNTTIDLSQLSPGVIIFY